MAPLRFFFGALGLFTLADAQARHDHCYVPKFSPNPRLRCNTPGYLERPDGLGDPTSTATDYDCAQLCGQNKQCKSYSWDTATKVCTLYQKIVRKMDFHQGNSSTTTSLTARNCLSRYASTLVVNPQFHGHTYWDASNTVNFGEDQTFVEAASKDPDGTIVQFSISQAQTVLCPNVAWKVVFTGSKSDGWGRDSYITLLAQTDSDRQPAVVYDVSPTDLAGGNMTTLEIITPSFTPNFVDLWTIEIVGQLSIDQPGDIKLVLNSLEIVPDTPDP